MVLGLQHVADRDGSSGQPRLNSDEELMHVQKSIAIVLGSNPPEPPGTLYISTKRVVWLSDTDTGKGYAVDFLSLSLHAVSRDPEAYPSPCIYAQIETEVDEDEESEGSDIDCDDAVGLSKIKEMRLVPSDPSQLDTIFDIFCQCAELNPEPNEDGEEENCWFFGSEEMVDDAGGEDSEWHFSENLANPVGYANGDQDLAHTVFGLQINDERFQDAEDEMENKTHHDHH